MGSSGRVVFACACACSVALAVALAPLVGCANQEEVIPLLRVEPNAGARMRYFERRSREMIAAQGDGGAASVGGDSADADAGAATEGTSWPDGGAPCEGTSCDPVRND